PIAIAPRALRTKALRSQVIACPPRQSRSVRRVFNRNLCRAGRDARPGIASGRDHHALLVDGAERPPALLSYRMRRARDSAPAGGSDNALLGMSWNRVCSTVTRKPPARSSTAYLVS